MTTHIERVGEIRPSQLMFSYGVGSIVDLPKLSVIVTGLEDWPTDPKYARVISEDRLLMAVRYVLPSVQKLLSPPVVRETEGPVDPLDSLAKIGVHVATFPRWMVCPQCGLLASLRSGLFKLKADPYHPDRTAYRHENCGKARRPPEVVPARFLVACEKGHLDDFPWIIYVHRGHPCDRPFLRLIEFGPSGEARDLFVECESCQSQRVLSDAFDPNRRDELPACQGRRPHLRDYDHDGCDLQVRPIILGASNTWFSTTVNALSIPVESGKLAKLVDEQWATLQQVTAPNILDFMRGTGQLGELSEYEDDELWDAIEERRARDSGTGPALETPPDLQEPEWRVFSQFDPTLNGSDFRLRPVSPPRAYRDLIHQVVLAERLREVSAMVGFTRIDAFGELFDPDLEREIEPAPLTRKPPTWVPAVEVRGEGIFIQFNEEKLRAWEEDEAVEKRARLFVEAHKKWRATRRIEPVEAGFPGMRYVMIHTFAHVLMRQLALECGYSAASLRERIYARRPEQAGGAMAGVLIYTAAPDSEGTLGGLVSLGPPEALERHIAQALEAASLCASDPLCAMHPPSQRGRTLHAAACHACTFAPETSCVSGNKYLDRATLVATVEQDDLAFFN